MQPMFRQVPPSSLSFSTSAVLRPSWAARIAATYPPGPEPMMMRSNLSIEVFSCGFYLDVAIQLVIPSEVEGSRGLTFKLSRRGPSTPKRFGAQADPENETLQFQQHPGGVFNKIFYPA